MCVSVPHADFVHVGNYSYLQSGTKSWFKHVCIQENKWKVKVQKKFYVGVVSKTAHTPGILGASVWIQKKMSL
jgi:hypothetical protein